VPFSFFGARGKLRLGISGVSLEAEREEDRTATLLNSVSLVYLIPCNGVAFLIDAHQRNSLEQEGKDIKES